MTLMPRGHFKHKGRIGKLGGSLPKGQVNLANLFRVLKGGAGSGNIGHAGIPGHRGGSAPGNSLISGAARNAEEKFSKILDTNYRFSTAKILGYSREEFETAVNNFSKVIEDRGQLTVSMGINQAKKVAETGEIRGREVVGTSHGTLPGDTSLLHRNTFDEAITKGINTIYATFGLDAAPYGNVSFLLDKKLLKNATVTPGDSIDQIVGGWRLEGKHSKEEVKDIFIQNALPGSYASRIAAAIALKNGAKNHIMSALDKEYARQPSIFDKNKTNMDITISSLAVSLKKEPYVEVQLFPKGSGISDITGILHRSLYPGKNFQDDKEWKTQVSDKFDVPFKESSDSFIYNFDEKAPAL